MLVVVSTIWMPACGGGDSDSASTTAASSSAVTPAVPSGSGDPPTSQRETPPTTSGGERPGETPSAPTSAELINAALDQGTLTPGRAAVLRFLAAFQPDKLPDEYRADSAGINAEQAIEEASRLAGTLSANDRAELAPWFTPPPFDGSAYREDAAVEPTTLGDPIERTCTASQDRYRFLDVADIPARVWWPKDSAALEAKARELAEALRAQIWPELFKVMGRRPMPDGMLWCDGGSDRVDYYLATTTVKRPTGNPADGFAQPDPPWNHLFHCKGKPVWIAINGNLSSRDLKATAAHETMHAILRNHAVCSADYGWLHEATASWAEDLVYPTFNTEHIFALAYLADTSAPINQLTGTPLYGTYLYLWYLSKRFGDVVVHTVWIEAERHPDDSLAAVEAATVKYGGWHKLWSDFAAHNLNYGPFTNYQKWDPGSLSFQAHPRERCFERPCRPNGGASDVVDIFVGAGYLTANYVKVTFPSSVRSVLFTAELTQGDIDRGAHIDAVYHVDGGEWHVQDWTSTPSLATSPPTMICRDLEDQRIDELIIILSYANWEGRSPLRMETPAQLTTSNIGCARWEGDITFTSYPGECSTSSATYTVHIVFQSTQHVVDGDGAKTKFEATAGSISVDDKHCTDGVGCKVDRSQQSDGLARASLTVQTVGGAVGGSQNDRRLYYFDYHQKGVFKATRDCHRPTGPEEHSDSREGGGSGFVTSDGKISKAVSGNSLAMRPASE
jgi:hypothetical protein